MLVLTVFAALPTIGLVNGPIYAPLIFGLALLRALFTLPLVGRAWVGGTAARLAIDLPLTTLAAAFALLCWASCLWSIVPEHSAAGAAQVTLILAAALLLLAGPPPTRNLPTILAIAVLTGTTVMAADRLSGNHLLHLASHHGGATKYNRGIDYLLVLLTPLLGILLQQRRWRLAAGLLVATIACVALGKNTTAWVALPAAGLVFLVARRAPRLINRLIAASVIIGAIGLPFALRLLSGLRAGLAPHLKESMLARLEIWDYVSARVVERPLSGWGIWSAKSLPITSEELSHYLREHGEGIYPHNQWLQLWVETGAIGLLLAVAFVLLILWRVQRQPILMQPYAYAALTLALMVSLTSFEITTDSWWAALAACAFLFNPVGWASAHQNHANFRISPTASPPAPQPPGDTSDPPAGAP